MSKQKKLVFERLQEFAGATRSEIIIALCVCTIAMASLIMRVVKDPVDPLQEALRERIRVVLDSSSRVHDSLRSLILLEKGDADSSELPLDIAAPSAYKAKKRPTVAINPAKASAQSLQSVPGIGPALAQRIVVYRTRHPIRRMEQLREVRGIGAKLYQKITAYFTLPSVSETKRARARQ